MLTTDANSRDPAPGSHARKRREITSAELLAQAREIAILHNGERYTLRITANNKLILTK